MLTLSMGPSIQVLLAGVPQGTIAQAKHGLKVRLHRHAQIRCVSSQGVTQEMLSARL